MKISAYLLIGPLLLLSFSLQCKTHTMQHPILDVLHYDIHLTLDWNKQHATGDATISLQCLKPTSEIQLSANELLIHSVNIPGNKSIAFETDTLSNKLNLRLDRIYNAGEIIHVTIAYTTQHINQHDPNAPGGSFGKGIRFFAPTANNPIRRKQCWSQSELFNTSYWLPCQNDIADLSTTNFTATVDKGLQFITNGELLTQDENPNGTTTYRYSTTKPYPIYLAAFAAGEYIDLVKEVHGVELHTWCYPDEKEAAEATIERLPEMLVFLEEKTGLTYPFDHYTQVMVQDYPFPGLTGQNTFSIVSDNMIDDYGTHKDFLYLWDGVAFNALASQWFGNTIMPEKTEDLWLTKSFAQYFEGKFTAETNGEAEYILWYHPWETANVFGDWQNGNRHPIVPENVEDPENFANDSYCKYRGALVLRMLENELGSEIFMESVRKFIRRNAFQPVSTSSFQEKLEQVSGKDLNWFFEQWIYATGHPVFSVHGEFDTGEKQYTLHIDQVQQDDTTRLHTPFFSGHMAIDVDGKLERIFLKPQKENIFQFHFEKSPHYARINTNHSWLCEIKQERSLEEMLSTFLQSRDMAVRSSAMQELSNYAMSENATQEEKQRIIVAFQKAIQEPEYWRFRYNLIGQLRGLQTQPYNESTIKLLVQLIENEESWIKAAALTSLGMTNDSSYVALYITCFDDISDRVRNAAAISLGKTKSSRAFDELVKLSTKPSWKKQSLMHCMSGMAQLGDKRGEKIALAALEDVQSPRWYLGNAWDYPFVAVQTLSTLGSTDKAFDLLIKRFNLAMAGNYVQDIFYQVLLITTLGNPRGREIINPLKIKFATDENCLTAIRYYEDQLNTLPQK